MTVQELIDKLIKIKDKSAIVLFAYPNFEIKKNFYRTHEIDAVTEMSSEDGNGEKFVWLENEHLTPDYIWDEIMKNQEENGKHLE